MHSTQAARSHMRDYESSCRGGGRPNWSTGGPSARST